MDGKFCFAVVVRNPVTDKGDLIGFFPREMTEQQLGSAERERSFANPEGRGDCAW